MMSRVKSRDTRPELQVRSALFRAGFRFRLHQRRLPGTPDIVLPRYRTAIFVHGCFWHGHDCAKGQRRPSTNTEFWNTKLDRNIERDRENRAALEKAGWNIRILWECNLQIGVDQLISELQRCKERMRSEAVKRPASTSTLSDQNGSTLP